MKQFDIIICALNSKYIHSSLAPWYLKESIKSSCSDNINVKIVEGTINDSMQSIADEIVKLNPEIIGFSCYIWNINHIKELIKLIKFKINPIIILGGPEVSFNAKEILDSEKEVDFIISGEGEKPIPSLINAIINNEDYSHISGLSFRQDNNIYENNAQINTKEPPQPYTNEYMHKLNGRLAYLETSRGCPFSCAFCLSGSSKNIRFFDLDRSKSEIIKLSKSGAKTIKLIDRTFNCNPKRASEIFKFIIDNYGLEIPKDICFHFEIAGDLLDEDTFELLSTAPDGLIQFEIGLQSLNPKTLKAINRNPDTTKLNSNIKKIVALGNIHIHVDLIAGLPYEDLESFKNSFNIAYALQPHMLQLGFLKLIHGSQMRDNPEIYPCVYSNDPPYEVIETPWIKNAELQFLHFTEDALSRLYNSGRYHRTLKYLLKHTKETPFDLISKFGEYTKEKVNRISLDDYTKLIFDYFIERYNIDKVVLRDIMVCDRLATNASGSLPQVLQIKDSTLKTKINTLELKKPPISGVRRGYAFLYSEEELIYVDYRDRHPVTGEFQIIEVN